MFPGPDAHVDHPGEPEDQTQVATRTARPAHRAPLHATGAGDIGRRLLAARRHRGLDLEEVARRAGMAPQYVAYLETHTADPGFGSLMRLADALGTTYADLREVARTARPGRERPFPPRV